MGNNMIFLPTYYYTMKLDILAFGAHPEDVEISAGGTLCAEAAKGKSVGIVDLTLGEMGTRGTPEIRLKEAKQAADIIGCKMRSNLELPDCFFEINYETTLKVIDIIRKYKPDIVLINAPHDRHPDHGRASKLVLEACFLSGLTKVISNDNSLKPWRPLNIYHYMQFYQHKPDFIYDITGFMDKKLACIKAHKSQFWDPESNEPETLIASKHFYDNLAARASEYGLQSGFSFGEPFIAARILGVKDLSSLV